MSLGGTALRDANLVLDESRTFVSPIFLTLASGSTEWVQQGKWPDSLGRLQCRHMSYAETRGYHMKSVPEAIGMSN